MKENLKSVARAFLVAFFAFSLVAAGFKMLPEGDSSCDMEIWYNQEGLQYQCPFNSCRICDVGEDHQAYCDMKFRVLDDHPAAVCECTDGASSTGDTCYAAISFLPGGIKVVCVNNRRPDCTCEDDFYVGFPEPHCENVSPNPILPTQACQCVRGLEEEHNPGDN